MKRKARLFALAEHLRARRTGVTAEQLAERFAVTVRTIYRDLDTLREAELPIVAERGPGGGFALDRSYNLPPINLKAREAALLVTLARHATEMRLLPFTATLAGALDKLRAALSLVDQRELERQTSRLLFVGVPSLAVAEPVREAFEQAWYEHRPLAVRYRHGDGRVSERRVRIARLLLERTMTIVECDDVDDGTSTRMRLSRIEHAKVVDIS